MPLVLSRKGRCALRPCGLRASVTDGLSRGSGVHPIRQNPGAAVWAAIRDIGRALKLLPFPSF